MEPKEKAKELLDKMNNHPVTTEMWAGASDYAKTDLKRKINIVVDECLNFAIFNCCEHQNRKFWEEVKQEIEKL